MFAIDTPAKWWDLVDSFWDDLIAVISAAEHGEDLDELCRFRQARDKRLARHLDDIRRDARRRYDLKRTFGWRLLADLCLDQSILHQAVVWRG